MYIGFQKIMYIYDIVSCFKILNTQGILGEYSPFSRQNRNQHIVVGIDGHSIGQCGMNVHNTYDGERLNRGRGGKMLIIFVHSKLVNLITKYRLETCTYIMMLIWDE
jgi:hypothetical protein